MPLCWAVMPCGNNELSLVLMKLENKSKTNIMSTYSEREVQVITKKLLCIISSFLRPRGDVGPVGGNVAIIVIRIPTHES